MSEYRSKLNVRETERAIKFVKDAFQRNFQRMSGFERISAPIMIVSGQGVNDDLNGVERPIRFDVPAAGREVEIVQSLAKWKRLALKRYGFQCGEGIYTDMNAIRRDDVLDAQHSVYVDQWDWEMVIGPEQRNFSFLKMAVQRIVGVIVETHDETKRMFPALSTTLSRDVTFVSSQEALDRYPDLSSKERERALAKEFGTVFLTNIGGALSNGKPHDGRAPDYDDWELNGDILFYDETLDDSIEISSMGIRVDAEGLKRQLKAAGAQDREDLEYHKLLLSNKLPLTIGGGIGQSRLCMLLLEKAHIGEVQAGVWSEKIIEECAEKGINLL